MKRTGIAIILLAFMCAVTAVAGEIRRIELKDGSVITGEVLSYSNGVYTIRSGSLGTIRLEDGKIRAIRDPGAGSVSPAAPATDAQVRPLQERMENDPEIMSLIRSLKDDASFRQVLEDPVLLKAVEAGDLATLMANPKFLQLLENSKVREIQEKVSK